MSLSPYSYYSFHHHNNYNATPPRIIITSNNNIKPTESPQSHQHSTPLSINKTQLSNNFNQYQYRYDPLLSSHYLPNLLASDNRSVKKSFTPYPICYTTEYGRSWKKLRDSFVVFNELYCDDESDKENVFCGANEKYRHRVYYQYGLYYQATPKSFTKALSYQQQNISSNKSNNNKKHLKQYSNLSDSSKTQIMQSINKKLNCSNIKTTLNLPDGSSDSLQSDNLLSRQSYQSREQKYNQSHYHMNIKESSSSSSKDIYSSPQYPVNIVGNVQMVLSYRPQSSVYDDSLSEDGSLSVEGNYVIEYFLTEEDSYSQHECNISSLGDNNNVFNYLKSYMNLIMSNENCYGVRQKKNSTMQKNKHRPIDYCHMLYAKIKYLSNNIAILHEKVMASDDKHHETVISSINSQSSGNLESKKHSSTMYSQDSNRHFHDNYNNITTINNHKLFYGYGFNKKNKKRNRLIYPDSKIIFSQNDSEYYEFSEEFSQVLLNDDSYHDYSMERSLRSRYNIKIVVHHQNSPVSIEIYEYLKYVLGCCSGKSERVNKSGDKCYQHFASEQYYDLLFEDESYFKNSNSNDDDNDSLSSSLLNYRHSFRLSFPKILADNQSSLPYYQYQCSPKLQSGQSFISYSSNYTYIQQYISNKKFNNKFNYWLMMN